MPTKSRSVTSGTGNPRYSLVVPVYNEEAVLPLLIDKVRELLHSLDGSGEAIFVDDGSTDDSALIIRKMVEESAGFRLIELSRNFGHQIAITAGLDAARGDAVIVMDADLQDPPEVVLDLVSKWQEGYDVVYARRTRREGESVFKRVTSHVFYRLLSIMTAVNIPRDVGDFRLVGRNALDAFKSMPERDRFVRGMFAWIGFKQTEVPFDRAPRAAGETKYPYWKMLRLAVHAIVSFSEKPLRIALWLGTGVSCAAALYGMYAIGAKLLANDVIDGWTSTIVIISFLSGINLFVTGIIGLYVGGIYAEVKRRPLYIVGRDSAKSLADGE